MVPQFLTRYGLQSYFVKQRDELVELTAMDSWVLNLTRSVKYSEEMHQTLVTVAKDVKAQIEFNPAWVTEYRQIGYEKRQLQAEDFNNDNVDAGDIGAGKHITLFYAYRMGVAAIPLIKANTKKVGHAASIVGMTVIGALVATYVRLSTTLEITAGDAVSRKWDGACRPIFCIY